MWDYYVTGFVLKLDIEFKGEKIRSCILITWYFYGAGRFQIPIYST